MPTLTYNNGYQCKKGMTIVKKDTWSSAMSPITNVYFVLLFSEQTSILIVLSKCFHIDRVGINEHYYVPDNDSAKYDPLFTNGGQQTLKPHTNVLLFGYQRGETTFVGHIIGCREDTFYFYEPLWSLSRKKYFTKDKQCWVNKEACR